MEERERKGRGRRKGRIGEGKKKERSGRKINFRKSRDKLKIK